MISAGNETSTITTLMDSISDLVCMTDSAGRLTYVNAVWSKYMIQRPGDALIDSIAPLAREQFAAALARLPSVDPLQTRLLDKNKDILPCRVRFVPDDNEIIVIFNMEAQSTRRTEELQNINDLLQHEINDRIQAEEEANRIYNLSVDMLGILDLDGCYVKINPAWTRTLGYMADQLLTSWLVEFVHEGDKSETQTNLEQLAAHPGRYLTFEHRFLHSDGTFRWLSWNAFQNHDDEMIYFVARDVTESKHIDTQFRLLNKAVEASNSAITIADVRLPDAPLVYVNPAFERITGYTADEILGRNCRFLQRDDRDQPGIEVIRESLREIKPCTVTLRNYRKDGTLFWNELRLTPMHDANGAISHFVGVATDITERIEAEQRIKSQNEALLRTNRALAEARKQAEAATRLKSEFLATMSHELRTPMNAVIGYTEILLAGMTGEINEEQRDYLGRVLTNAEHLLALINDVLDLSKIEAGRVDLVRKSYHLGELLHEIVAQTRGLAEEKGLSFESYIDPHLPAVLVGDPDRIKQIAINLLSNAIKFTSAGSVQIILRQHGMRTWTLTVQDTGIGISKSNQETIFEEFRQLDATWQREHSGTGLGLAIVRKLALLMGGSIRVQSAVDEGSIFTVFLPIDTNV